MNSFELKLEFEKKIELKFDKENFFYWSNFEQNHLLLLCLKKKMDKEMKETAFQTVSTRKFLFPVLFQTKF